MEAEKFSLLEAATKQLVSKEISDWEILMCILVIYKNVQNTSNVVTICSYA
jgi:hypothetical protein